MPIRFFRRFRIIPGLRLNVSKSGVSLSVGQRGIGFTIGPRGPRATVGLPGTGLSYWTTRRGSPVLWIIGAIALGAAVMRFVR